MSERYSKLSALPENLYSTGAPVIIAAGALLKDNQTGKVLAQLKIRNIQDKAIKAATVTLTPLDTVNQPLGGTVDHQYLDLSAARDTDFGQKVPVFLPDQATRAFSISVAQVIFRTIPSGQVPPGRPGSLFRPRYGRVRIEGQGAYKAVSDQIRFGLHVHVQNRKGPVAVRVRRAQPPE